MGTSAKYSTAEESVIREDVFRWLDRRLEFGSPEITRKELLSYTYDGVRIPLLDTSRGIRNPQRFEATLSIMSSSNGPYDDAVTDDGFVHPEAEIGLSARGAKLPCYTGRPASITRASSRHACGG